MVCSLLYHITVSPVYTDYMDNHAVPRQITTFEFKLLGFFTVKQNYLFQLLPLPLR